LKCVKPVPPSTEEEGKKPKTSALSDTDVTKREALDAKVIYSLYCAFSPFEYN